MYIVGGNIALKLFIYSWLFNIFDLLSKYIFKWIAALGYRLLAMTKEVARALAMTREVVRVLAMTSQAQSSRRRDFSLDCGDPELVTYYTLLMLYWIAALRYRLLAMTKEVVRVLAMTSQAQSSRRRDSSLDCGYPL